MPLFVLFILWPILEIVTFFGVADEIGFFTAMGLIILSAICGGWLLRYQSLQAIMSASDSMRARKLPSQELFDAACMIGAGILLIIPGFLTDILALLLLIRPLRAKFRDELRERGDLKPGDVIDVEFEHVEEDYERLAKKDKS